MVPAWMGGGGGGGGGGGRNGQVFHPFRSGGQE